MSVSSTNATSSALTSATSSSTNPKGTLGKDDFMKLLLVQLQYQDPTSPMDTEKILTQTSQLAALESSDNTKTALENLSAALGTAQQFSTISAIGKTADLGSDAISLTKGSTSTFEVYFPKSIQDGTISIKDSNGATVKTLSIGTNPSGVYQFTWDGTDQAGNQANGGIYHVTADYADQSGATQTTRLGAYPIESIKFDKGTAYAKLGSNYVSLDKISEVY